MATARKRKGVTARGRGSASALVKVRAVTEPPSSRRTISVTQRKYQAAMAQVRKKGKGRGWFEIATYASATGAAVVKREMLAGKRLIDGKLSDWEIESRRLHDDDGRVIGSALYVRLK